MSHSSVGLSEELGPLVIRDLAVNSLFLFFFNSFIEIIDSLAFEGLLAGGFDGFCFGGRLHMLVGALVDIVLVRVLVVLGQLKLSVDLISKSSLSTVLNKVNWSVAPERIGIVDSQRQKEQFLDFFISIKVLLESSGEVSVGLDD